MADQTQLPPTIFEDDYILVFNKPAGLIVQLSHTHDQPTLEEALPDIPGLERKGIVHRLDKDTSGVMVVSKTASAQANLQQQFKDRQTQKEYFGLVWGRVKEDHAIIDAPILRHPVQGHKYVVAEGGREANSEWWVLSRHRLDQEPVTYLRLQPHSGRTHQLRVHLAALGHPLIGDPVYGRRKDRSFDRQCLHAHSLTLLHPQTGQSQTFIAPLAPDIEQFLTTLQPDE